MKTATLAEIATWLTGELGAAIVEPTGALHGSTTASVRTFRVQGVRGARGVGAPIPVVVKRYDRDLPGVDGGEFAAAEARGLTAAEQAGLPAPRLLAVDADGARTGAPAVAMTRLRGEAQARPSGAVDDWVGGLAEMLVRIAAAPQPSVVLPAFESWRAPFDAGSPPDWITDGATWRAAVERVDAGFDGVPPTFIHRDYQQFNVLWDHGAACGVIDWANACDGPIQLDISRCRVNIATVCGAEAADAFLAACGDVGRDYDRAWDLETVFSLLADTDVLLAGNDHDAGLTAGEVRSALAAVVAGAVAT